MPFGVTNGPSTMTKAIKLAYEYLAPQHTDASYSGLGAVLSRYQNGKRRVIEYSSRTLKDAEARCPSNELECTTIHWALTEVYSLSTWS
ncbi:hypothetical protein TNCV_2228751 [Trichonephila clavipes]|nr:hypothetical protein TNCV_2228751 [Trichonephila clavipes]